MRLISWNVNGLRAILKKNFMEVFDMFDADIFAVQETKCQAGQVELDTAGYYQYWSYANKKGYAGTAVFCKEKPSCVLHGLGDNYLDEEGRIVAVELREFWLVNVYTPNAQSELARLGHRMQWDDAFRDFCKGLEEGTLPAGVAVEYPLSDTAAEQVGAVEVTKAGEHRSAKPVVICGDFNVAHEEIDLKNPDPNRGNAGFSDEEREKFTELLDAGFVDTFRRLHPKTTGAYSWWSYRFNARKNNAGWRIDYFIVSDDLVPALESADIFSEVLGSDHCPVGLELAL